MADPKDTTNPSVSAQASAGAQATIINRVTVNVVNPHAPHGGTRHHTPQGNHPVGHGEVPNATNRLSSQAGTSSEHATVNSRFDTEGEQLQTISDGHGGSVILSRVHGVVHAQYLDNNEVLRTRADSNGFEVTHFQHYTEAGEPRTRSFHNSATGGTDSTLFGIPLYGLRGNVTCETHGYVAASNPVVDSVTRTEITDFLNRHPSIRDQLRNMNVPITNFNDVPVTASAVLAQPGNFRACPADDSLHLIVQRLR